MATPNIEEVVARMTQEVMADVYNGRVPFDVKNFSELHDFVDANCYGGFCDDAIADPMIEAFGGRNPDGDMPDAAVAFFNEAQDRLSNWLVAGKLVRSVTEVGPAMPWIEMYAKLLRKHKELLRTVDGILHVAGKGVLQAKGDIQQFRERD